MVNFSINGYIWSVKVVRPMDYRLVDRTGSLCYATTDPVTKDIYVSNDIYGSFLKIVIVHELGHCVIFSYNLLPAIHRMVIPEYWIEAEEWICNFVANYGPEIFDIYGGIRSEYPNN